MSHPKYINAVVAYRRYGIARGLLRALHEQGVIDRQERESGRYVMYVYSEEDIRRFIDTETKGNRA